MIKFFLIIVVLNSVIFGQGDKNLFLIKNNQHVGIVFIADSTSVSKAVYLDDKDSGKIIDIGWGDAAYYPTEDPSIWKGAAAILWPTASVVRVAKYNGDLKSAVRFSDYSVKIYLNDIQYLKILEFINLSFSVNDSEKIINSQTDNEFVSFYESDLSYHLYNTCNTWIADALKHAGFDIESDGIVTASGLFHELKNIGEVLKSEE